MSNLEPDSHEGAQAIANHILMRASAISKPSAKEIALQIARLVLAEAPAFGSSQLADDQIIAALEAEQIGLPTFKKALSIARKELVRKPQTLTRRAKKGPAGEPKAVELSPRAKGAVLPHAGPSIAQAVDRKLL